MQLNIEDIPEVTSRVQMVVKKLPSVLTGLKYLKRPINRLVDWHLY